MSFGVRCAQALVHIYIGGGGARPNAHMCVTLKYDCTTEECVKLPKSSVHYFALASVKDQVLLAGGERDSPAPPDIQLLDSESAH